MMISIAVMSTLAWIPSSNSNDRHMTCEKKVSAINYKKLSQLPSGATAALGFEIAEKGAPFQATDVGNPPPLPSTRFVSAIQRGCVLTIAYEQGGFAHQWRDISLTKVSGTWKVIAVKNR